VWACNDGENRYVRGIHRAIELCGDLFSSGPNLMLGDFNSNTFWDEDNPPDRNHSALVKKLGDLGLVSAYHAYFQEEQGSETRPTYFQYRHRHRPYHIDYCFVPQAWAPRIASVTLGRHFKWRRWSDHMPLRTNLLDRGPGNT
jgi:endonuclease/exonuclease/phosphatase family metal-dependent hydrolase